MNISNTSFVLLNNIYDFINGRPLAHLSIIEILEGIQKTHKQPTNLPYHNIAFHTHKVAFECLYQINEKSNVSYNEKVALIIAAWFHDIIYNPFGRTNEEDSVNALFLAFPIGLHLDYLDYKQLIISAILATKHKENGATHLIEQILCDADLAILSHNWIAYTKYINAIRAEYSIYNDIEWRNGRLEWLDNMLDRKQIYYRTTDREKAARANLAKEREEILHRSAVFP